MRIALITPEYPGCGPSFGVGRYVQALARALTQSGDAVCVAVIGEQGTWLGHADQVHLVNRLQIPALLRPRWSQSWLSHVLNDLVPDVVEIPNWGGLGAWLPRQWPSLVRLSTSIVHERARDRLRHHLQPFHLRLETATVRRADWLVADSAAIADCCAPIYRRRADMIIPHAIPCPIDPPINAGHDVLFVGRLDHRKGIDILLRAWPHINRQFPAVRLHVVGRDQRQFAQRFAHLSAQQVQFHGHITAVQLTQLRQQCAIHVVPSRFESFGLVVLEAWAYGQAVIASDIPALNQTVTEAGLLFPNENYTALAQQLNTLLADQHQCKQLQQRGYERLVKNHSIPTWIAATRKAYGHAIAKAQIRQQRR
jgi:glycosyltransferase involved in cell wall biosynthesis